MSAYKFDRKKGMPMNLEFKEITPDNIAEMMPYYTMRKKQDL